MQTACIWNVLLSIIYSHCFSLVVYDEGNPGCKTYLPQQSPKGFLYEDLWRRHEEADRQKAECAGEDRYSVKILLKFAVCFFRALLVFRCYLLHDDHMDNCEKTVLFYNANDNFECQSLCRFSYKAHFCCRRMTQHLRSSNQTYICRMTK